MSQEIPPASPDQLAWDEVMFNALLEECRDSWSEENAEGVVRVYKLAGFLEPMIRLAAHYKKLNKYLALDLKATLADYGAKMEEERTLTQPCPECKAAPHKLSCSRPEEKPDGP